MSLSTFSDFDGSRLPPSWEIPTFVAQEFTAQRRPFALCVFVLNEGDRIRRQLPGMHGHCGDVDLIVADGGSSDGSLDREFLAACGVRTLLVKTGRGGLSAQMRMALAYSLHQEYRGIVVMDGNDKDGPDAVPRFVSCLRGGFDHVQGSRFVPGGRAINTPLIRWAGLRMIHAPLVSLAAGRSFSDSTNGFRAYSRRLLLDERVAPFRKCFDKYELHYYLAIRAARLGYRLREVPVTRAYPGGEAIPTKIHGWRGNFGILRALADACRGRFDPPPQRRVGRAA